MHESSIYSINVAKKAFLWYVNVHYIERMQNIMSEEQKLPFTWPLLGHNKVKHYLQSCLQNGSLAHAYLFSGPRHTGKTFTASLITSTLLCEQTDKKKPCNDCNSCIQISKGLHADVIFITLQEGKKNISIDQIRELQHSLSLRSFLANYKITIIEDAELLNEESANALLKTLEEPGEKTLFILCTAHKEALPETIISRCQTIQFNLVPQYIIENWLISRGKSKKEARIIARFSDGRPGIAAQMLHNESFLNERSEHNNALIEFLKSDLNKKFTLINSLIQSNDFQNGNEAIDIFFRDWIILLRDIILVKNNIQHVTNVLFINQISILARNMNIDTIQRAIVNITSSRKLLKQSVNPKLILENLVLSI